MRGVVTKCVPGGEATDGSRIRHAWRSLVLIVLMGVAAPASAQDRKDEDQGVVIGAVVVKVADPTGDSSVLRGARRLDKVKWGLTIEKSEGFTFANRRIDVRSGSEEHFLVKLPAGSYRFEQLVGQGFANFYFPIQVRFDVAANATTYIGKLEITIPYRMYESPAAFRVLDSQDETISTLTWESLNAEAVVSTDLMSIF